MKKDEVEIGGVYQTKVGGKPADIRIDSGNAKGGWNATATATGKPVRVKDARDLRPAQAGQEATTGAGEGEGGDAGAAPAKPRKRADTAKRAAKAPREKAPAKPKPMSCLDAAAAVLKASGQPMQCRAMIDAMKERGLWSSSAPTPHATLFSAILRELRKGAGSRFKKVDRGQFPYQESKGK